MSELERLADRLRDSGLGDDRFIDVHDGEKASTDHEQRSPSEIDGNYGIYANGNDGLVLLDIDDYGDLEDKSGIAALSNLPPTFEQQSPHGGTHRFYVVEPTDDGKLIAAAFEDQFGTANPNPSWGEVRTKNQYVVGAGSQLDGCDKDWCDECEKPDSGYYTIQNNREIATISASELIDSLSDDPDLQPEEAESPSDSSMGSVPDDVEKRLSFARESDDKLDRLMRGDYSDYDGDRSRAESALAYKLAFWLGGDRNLVEDVIDRKARTKKWDERDDDSYRNSVLKAVDKQSEFYEPSSKATEDSYAPDIDWGEVDRGEAILDAERGVTDPYGDLIHKDGHYGYNFETTDENGNSETYFVSVTNFTLELENIIDTYEGKLLSLRVHPASPMEDSYSVDVAPTVFNSPQAFSEEIVRGRTTYFNPQKNATETLNNLRLTVGHQNAPQHVGTEYIGLHGSSYDEWVTPAGTLTADGWADNPTHKYFEKGGAQEMESSLEDKWNIDPSDGAEYDKSTVAEICSWLPEVRTPERGMPILGWFYAAPLKPIIQNIEGEFNLLQVTGDTEVGKTAVLQLYYQLFGADPAPFGCGDTNFTIEKKFAGSNGLPIWLDEYKPTDLSERKLDWLHRRLREVTREKTISKGRTDLGEITFKMKAPVVFSGEQTVSEAAVRRRTIMTTLSQEARSGAHQKAFSQLTGATYSDSDGDTVSPGGLDLGQHALAYYRYLLTSDPEDIRDKWSEARQMTRDHLEAIHVPDLDGSEFQGLQTIVFGVEMYREFAQNHGVDEEKMPDASDVRRAIEHVVSNIGPEGRRREHIDEFVELMNQAASAGYLSPGEHHRVYDPKLTDGEALAFHMPTTFAAVKKYVREYNVGEEYSLLGKNDYLDSFRDKVETGSYPVKVNHRVRKLENGSKCVVLDPQRADDVLPDGFNLDAFRESQQGENGIQNYASDDGYVTVRGEIASLLDPKPWLQAEGTFENDEVTMSFVARGSKNPLSGIDQGDTVEIIDAAVTEDKAGSKQLEMRDGVTKVSKIGAGESESQTQLADQEPAADGGTEEDHSERIEKIREVVANKETEASGVEKTDIVVEVSMADFHPEKVKSDIEKMKKRGELYTHGDGLRLS